MSKLKSATLLKIIETLENEMYLCQLVAPLVKAFIMKKIEIIVKYLPLKKDPHLENKLKY